MNLVRAHEREDGMAGKPHLSLPQGNFFYLLVSLLLIFLVYPFVKESVLGVRFLDIILSAILLSAIYAVSQKKQLFIIALVLALPTLAIHWSKYFVSDPYVFFAGESMTALFLIFTGSIILIHVFRDEEVTANKIAGAICVYLLIGLTWGIFFALIEDFQPGSFLIEHTQVTSMEEKIPQMMYYSFVNLTTLGYGDITPLAPPARTFSIVEAIIGQMYLVVLVARLVGLHIVHSTRKHSG
jgi:hypothetical protein